MSGKDAQQHSDRRERRIGIRLAAIALLLGGWCLGGGIGSAAAQGAEPTTSQISLSGTNDDALLAEHGSRYGYIIVRDSMHTNLAELRQEHPEAKILVYKDMSFTINDPGCPAAPYEGAGVSYCDADSHESWFLHDKRNKRLSSDGYSYLRAMNIKNAGYRKAWASDVLARLDDAQNDGSNERYDGVFMDDTNLYPGHGMDGRIQELSDGKYRRATVKFVDAVSSQIKAAGYLTMPNLALDPGVSSQRSAAIKVARDVSAVNREGFVRWGEGPLFTDPIADSGSWRNELTLEEEIQDAGAGYHAITYGSSSDTETQRYARATFLMGWDGTDGSALAYRTDGGNSYLPDWTTDVGTPTGERHAVGDGWRRDFTGGTVMVNPQPSGSQSFDLGASYKVPGAGCKSSVTLGATRALVLPRC